MKRIKEIDEFLKMFRDAYKKYPDYNFNDNTFYNELKFYGFKQEERDNCLIDNYCQEWLNYYRNDFDRLNVEHKSNQPWFIQFNHFDSRNPSNFEKHYKLYLSFDKEHINDAVKTIFNYMRDNNIKHVSKVARKVRSDAVVLRIIDKEDLEKVLNFVKSNPYLQKNAKNTNPFLGRINGVGVSYDNDSSYNSVVSHILRMYFDFKKANNDLKSVGYSNFLNYVNQYKQELEKNPSFLERECDYKVFEYNHQDSVAARGLNLIQIVEMLQLNMSGEINIDKYTNQVEKFRREKSLNSRYFTNRIDNDAKYSFTIDKLLESCQLTYMRYGDFQLREALKMGMSGEFGAFSNEKDKNGKIAINYRGFFKENLNKDNIMSIYKGLLFKYRGEDYLNDNAVIDKIVETVRLSLEKDLKNTCIL